MVSLAVTSPSIKSEAVQVTGGIRGALDSVVSTENGQSVLLSSEASLGRGLHNLNQMIGQVTDRCLVIHPSTGLLGESRPAGAGWSNKPSYSPFQETLPMSWPVKPRRRS